MNKQDIIRKLTSRKLWLAIVGLVIAVCSMFNANAELIDKITGLVMAVASVVGYILGEGLVDAANKPPDSGEASETKGARDSE